MDSRDPPTWTNRQTNKETNEHTDRHDPHERPARHRTLDKRTKKRTGRPGLQHTNILLNFKQYFAPLQTAFLVPRFQREAPRMTLCEPSGSPLGLPLGPSWGPSGDPPGEPLETLRRAPPGEPSGGVQKWSKRERARSASISSSSSKILIHQSRD